MAKVHFKEKESFRTTCKRYKVKDYSSDWSKVTCSTCKLQQVRNTEASSKSKVYAGYHLSNVFNKELYAGWFYG